MSLAFLLCLGAFPVYELFFSSPALKASEAPPEKGAKAGGAGALTPSKPAGSDAISSSYRNLARSSVGRGSQLEGINYLRLAFIYATEPGEKESLLLERGELYLAMKNYHEASLTFQIFNRHFPDSPLLHLSQKGLADAQLHLGRHDDALRNYEKAGQDARTVLGRMKILSAQGKTSEAFSLLESLSQQEREDLKTSDDFVIASAEIMRSQGRHQEARKILDDLKSEGQNSRKEYLLGMIALAEDDHKNALKHMENALGTMDRELRKKVIPPLAELKVKTGGRNDAKTLYREFIREYPFGKEHRSAIITLAEMEKNDGRQAEALTLLREAIFVEPPDARARDMAAEMLLSLSESDKAAFLKHWGVIGRKLLDPSRVDILFRLAQKLRNEGRPFMDLCGWIYQSGKSPMREECGFLLAQIYGEMGDYTSARKYLEKLDPREDKAMSIKAMIYAENREYDRAIDLLKAIRNPSRADVKLMSDLIPEVKDKKTVVSLLERGLSRGGGDALAYARLADYLYQVERRRDALQYYQIAQALQLKNEKVSAGDRDWVSYRIAEMVNEETAVSLLNAVSNKDPLLSRIVDARKKELALNRQISGMLQ